MQERNPTMRKVYALVVFALLGLFFSPTLASAQAFVPVRDQQLNSAFSTYSNNFNTYSNNFDTYADNFDKSVNSNSNTDSLREIIASGDPQGITIEECEQRDNRNIAQAYAGNYPWANAVLAASTTANPLPNDVKTSGKTLVQINASASVRCLLQEIVEWQKLGLSLQIHTLLKSYIADAQTKQLNNQLMNQVSAANLNWAKAGNEVVSSGILSSEPVYETNRSQSEYNVKGRQLDHILDKASADPTAGNAVGSLGICQPWRLDTAANLARNARTEVQDPSGFEEETTSCSLTGVINPNDYSKFSESFNDPASTQGGFATFMNTFSPANSPLGASTAADSAARSRLLRQQESTRLEAANSGFKSTKKCSGDASDPYCLDQQNSIAITPAGQNQRNVSDVAQQGNQQIQSGNSLDATAGSSADTQSTELNTNSGLLGYDETGLAQSTTVVNRLIKEFYDAIEFGYFGLDGNPSLTKTGAQTPTSDWARGTMLSIYDQMKFDDTSPNVIVTDGQTSVNTGY